jgi:hypothetical protein
MLEYAGARPAFRWVFSIFDAVRGGGLQAGSRFMILGHTFNRL